MHIQVRLAATHGYSMHQYKGTPRELEAAVKYAEQSVCALGWEPPSWC